jgi:hypothetical protein
MHFSLKSRPAYEKKTPFLLHYPKGLPKPPDRPLDFWWIERHDRDTLLNRIMPYMKVSLRKKHPLQSVLDQHSWAKELLYPEFEDTNNHDPGWFHRTTAALWTDPATLTTQLLSLTRVWFFLLLHYTYRKHFFEGREAAKSDLNVRDFCANRGNAHTAAFTDDELSRLTRQRNRYGASFYRRSYRDTNKRSEWTRFCDRIRIFCRSIGLQTYSDDPESNIRELRSSITSIVLHQRVQTGSTQHNILMRNMAKRVRKLDERIASGAVHNEDAVKNLRRRIQEMGRLSEELQRRSPLLEGLLRRDLEIHSEVKELRLAYESILRCIDRHR